MRNEFFIDESGTLVPLSAAERDPFSTYEQCLAFFIEQMGFVHLLRTNRSTTITFDKTSVSLGSLIGATYWVGDVDLQKASFKHPAESTISLQQTIGDCIAYLSAHIERVGKSGRFKSAPVPLAISPFSNRYQAAAEICAEVSVQRRDQLLHLLFQGLYMLTETDPMHGKPRIVSMGAGHLQFDAEFVSKSKGRTLCDIHDKDFGIWLAQEYATARDSGEARCDDVSALVDWQSRGKSRHMYSRLLMPVFQTGGRSLLLTATHLN
jgi:hypothetical protein